LSTTPKTMRAAAANGVLLVALAGCLAGDCLGTPLQDASYRQAAQQQCSGDQGAAGFSPARAFALPAAHPRQQRAMALSQQQRKGDARAPPAPGLARMLARPPRRVGSAGAFCAASMSAGAELVSVDAAKAASFEQVCAVRRGRGEQAQGQSGCLVRGGETDGAGHGAR